MALRGNNVLLTELAIALIFLSLQLPCIQSISQATSPSSNEVNTTNIAQTFEQWMEKYGRSYPNSEEKSKRFALFQTNLEYVEKFNKQQSRTYKIGLNQFSDMTSEEIFLGHQTGLKRMATFSASQKYQNMPDDDVPDSIDWRKQGAVTPVKNQRQCGSCWAFSVVAAVEGYNKLRTGKLISLSEQELVDCNKKACTNGCKGGYLEPAFQYIQQNGGISSEEYYKYRGKDGACYKNKERQYAAKITGYKQVPGGEMYLLKAVSRQPVSVLIRVSRRDFMYYSSGVFSGDCGNVLNHAVAVVGYGKTEDDIDYWLLKNSWGENWGENGYMRILRNSGSPEGHCGLATYGFYPTNISEIHKQFSSEVCVSGSNTRVITLPLLAVSLFSLVGRYVF